MRKRNRTALGGTLVVVAFALTVGISVAQDKAECVGFAERGQQHRRQGALLAAIRDFQRCARETCPAVVLGDCSRFLLETESSLPTVVFHARDEAGRDVIDMEVKLDGVVVARKLDGRAVALDPGEHVVSFSARGWQPAERRFVAMEGDKLRSINVRLHSLARSQPPRVVPSAAPTDASKSHARAGTPNAVWVLGGVGVAALAGTTYFGLSAASDRATLEKTCGATKSCTQEQVDAFRRKALVADVLLSAGIGALAGAVIVWAASEDGTPRTTATLSVSPVGAAAMAGMRHAF